MFNSIIAIILGFVEGFAGFASEFSHSMLATRYMLAVLLPWLAVGVRRLHDTGRSGWWLLIGIVPIIGAIVLLVFMVQQGQSDENEYDPNPKEAVASARSRWVI